MNIPKDIVKNAKPSSVLLKFPLISHFINNLDRDVSKLGFQEGMLNVVKRSRSKLIIQGFTNGVRQVLKGEAVVVVVNHPHEAEALALIASLPKREDARLIINFRFSHFCPSLEKYFIPVYVDHHVGDKYKKSIFGRLMRRINRAKSLPEEEEHKRNIESIKKASKVLSDDGLIIIFPGRRSVDGHWFSGVGHLLKGFKSRRTIYVVNVFNEGTSDLDYFRIIPGIGRFLPKVIMVFGKPKVVNHLLTKDAKEITRILETEYFNWTTKVLHKN